MQMGKPPIQFANSNRTSIQLGPLIIFASVASAHIIYVSLYGSALPCWDQWDELNNQLISWLDGTWHFTQLFSAHHQHRIVFTRLVTFTSTALNSGIYDNLVETYINTLIYALLQVILYIFFVFHDRTRARRIIIAFVIVVLGVLPFDWENTVVGLQNSFYFLELTAVILLGVAAYRARTTTTVYVLAGLAVASLFTLASGLLVLPVAAGAVFLRRWHTRDARHDIYAFVVLASTFVVGVILLEQARIYDSLQATSASDFGRAFLVATAWPLQARGLSAVHLFFAAMIWAPGIFWTCSWVRHRNRSIEADELFAISLAGWVLLQFVAIAYSRGHDMLALPSRYSEIAAIGIAANVWIALKLIDRWPGLHYSRLIVACGMLVLGYVFLLRTPGDFFAMWGRHVFTTIETQNVQRLLAGQPLPVLSDQSLDLPYKSAEKLHAMLDNAEIRSLLPPSVSPVSQSGIHRPAPLSTAAAAIQSWVRRRFPARVWSVTANELATFTTSAFVSYTGPVIQQLRNTQCSLDSINGRAAAAVRPVAQNSVATFDGWMGDGKGGAVVEGALLLKNQESVYITSLVTGGARPDVAQALHSKVLATAGFNLMAMMNGVAPGTYSLLASSTNPPNASTFCDLHASLVVH